MRFLEVEVLELEGLYKAIVHVRKLLSSVPTDQLVDGPVAASLTVLEREQDRVQDLLEEAAAV